MDEAVIIGVAEEPLAKGVFAIPASPLQAQARVARAALAQAGLTLADVDGLCTANLWGVGGAGMLPTITLSGILASPRPFMTEPIRFERQSEELVLPFFELLGQRS